MDTNCKSFNFQEATKLCELSSTTRVGYPNDLIEAQGSMYFDALHDTPLFSKPDPCLNNFTSCKTLKEAGHLTSGVYFICPDGLDKLQVYCDMDSAGGGWIVFQSRQDGSVDFNRGWDEYKSGFGSLSGEFWLGNDNLVGLTSDESQGGWELRVDLEDGRSNNTAWAQYNQFKIVGEKYSLYITDNQRGQQ
ncbi:ficolin-2-like [Asterias rubens]|uniref:ficolin-2-like n=1 Tax=Asterias rubens TaxID=7604 RepID=UPI001455DB96|nr:ficolin-2-like [Asterias rubens]